MVARQRSAVGSDPGDGEAVLGMPAGDPLDHPAHLAAPRLGPALRGIARLVRAHDTVDSLPCGRGGNPEELDGRRFEQELAQFPGPTSGAGFAAHPCFPERVKSLERGQEHLNLEGGPAGGPGQGDHEAGFEPTVLRGLDLVAEQGQRLIAVDRPDRVGKPCDIHATPLR
jgi:hypothetical protein